VIVCQHCWLARRGLCEATCRPESPVRIYCARCGLPLDASRRVVGRTDWWICERGCNRNAGDAAGDPIGPALRLP